MLPEPHPGVKNSMGNAGQLLHVDWAGPGMSSFKVGSVRILQTWITNRILSEMLARVLICIARRQQSVRLQPPHRRPGRGERALQRPAEGAERSLHGWPRRDRARRAARQAGGHEHPVVREREGRPAFVQTRPAAGAEQVAAPGPHPGERTAAARTRFRPGAARRAEARTRLVDHLHRAPLWRGVGERPGKRAQGLGVDAGKGRQLDHETGGARVDIELARLVEGAPGQEGKERRIARTPLGLDERQSGCGRAGSDRSPGQARLDRVARATIAARNAAAGEGRIAPPKSTTQERSGEDLGDRVITRFCGYGPPTHRIRPVRRRTARSRRPHGRCGGPGGHRIQREVMKGDRGDRA